MQGFNIILIKFNLLFFVFLHSKASLPGPPAKRRYFTPGCLPYRTLFGRLKYSIHLNVFNFLFSYSCLEMHDMRRKIILKHDFFCLDIYVYLDSNTRDNSRTEIEGSPFWFVKTFIFSKRN